MEGKARKNVYRMLSGGLIGVANGLFGGGGGMIAVPLLNQLGLREKRAHATAILLILPISVGSFLLYAWKGFAKASILIPTGLGVTFGGILGAKLLGKLPTKIVRLLFAILQAVAGIFLFLSN